MVTDDRGHLAGPFRLDPEARLLGRPLGDTRTMLLPPGREGCFASRAPGISWAIIVDKGRLATQLRLVHHCSLAAALAQGWATVWTAGDLDLLVNASWTIRGRGPRRHSMRSWSVRLPTGSPPPAHRSQPAPPIGWPGAPAIS